jgi:hypothetical protein
LRKLWNPPIIVFQPKSSSMMLNMTATAFPFIPLHYFYYTLFKNFVKILELL